MKNFFQLDIYHNTIIDKVEDPTFFDQPKHSAKANRDEIYFEKIRPELTERQNQVLDAVEKIQPCTMHQVAEEMNVPLNTISGRFGELVEKELLEITGRKERKSIYKMKVA